jgi:transcriptional regulator of acetoin/glycerol metabolism
LSALDREGLLDLFRRCGGKPSLVARAVRATRQCLHKYVVRHGLLETVAALRIRVSKVVPPKVPRLPPPHRDIFEVGPGMPRPLEQEAATALIVRHRGNLTSVAREVGVTRTTLYERLEYLGLAGFAKRVKLEARKTYDF